jgi:hypothetical protein
VIIFRANTPQEALLIIQKILSFSGPIFIDWTTPIVPFSLFGIFLLLAVEIKQEYFKDSVSVFNHPNSLVRYSTYTFLFLTILLIGVFDGGQFIYFQF